MSSDEQHQQMSSSSSVRTSVTSSSASYSTATAEGQNVSDRRDPFFHSLSYYIRWLTRRFFISWINLFNPAEMSCLVSELTSLIIKWASEWLTRRPVLIDRPLCRRQNSRQKFRLFFTLLGPCLSIITQFNTRWMPCKSDRRHLNIPLRAITHRHWLTTTAWMTFTRILRLDEDQVKG